jgi:hypothetical protein
MKKSKSFDIEKTVLYTLERSTLRFLKYIHNTKKIKVDTASMCFSTRTITVRYRAENNLYTKIIKWHNYTTYVILELYSPSQPLPNESEGVAS